MQLRKIFAQPLANRPRPGLALRLTMAVILAAMIALPAPQLAAQSGAALSGLTGSLIDQIGEHGRAADHLKPGVAARLQDLAAQRHQQLTALMESDPGAVLQMALPAALRQSAPASARNFIEEQVEMDGELQVLHEDRAQGSRFVYKLKAFGLDYALNFKKTPPTHLSSGARVTVRGVRVNTALALDSGASLQTVAAIASNTFGAQRTLVILVNFRNNTAQPYDAAFAASVFTNTSNFFLENSYGQTSLTTTVKGWYTIDMDAPSGSCDYSSIASKADAAATGAGVTLSSYTRKVYAFPYSNGCGWWGLGSVGGNPSSSWINGSLELRVAAHELGHNLGLWHSHSWDCGAAVLGGSCTASDYGDTLDVMGSSSFHFNAFQKERLGWLNYGASPPITTANGTGSYAIYPYTSTGSTPKALKIVKSTNASTGKSSYFYAECRRPLGFDAGIGSASYPNVTNGFVIHTGDEADSNSSYLLDLTPATSSWYDPALVAGMSFVDATSGVTISADAPCGDNLNGLIGVTIGPVACVRANPDLTITPSASQTIARGGSVTYTLSLKNLDNSGCATGSFNLAPTVPSGWSASFGSASLAVAPGATATTTMTVTAPSGATDGLYLATATAHNAAAASYTDSVSASIVVYTISSVTVALTTDKTSYARNKNVNISATVTVNGSAAASQLVTLTITNPTGATTTVSLTTNSTGVAKHKYHIGNKDPLGTWQIQGTSAAGGITGSGSKTFLVQ